MPNMLAVSSKNCAMTMQTPAAMSCCSLMAREIKAKAVATIKLPTATAFSMNLEPNM